MNMHRLKTLVLAAAMSVGALVGTVSAHADTVDAVLNVGQSITQAARESQQRVDRLAGETNTLLTDYRQVNKQIDGLRVYNERLERQIANQERRIADYESDIQGVTVIQRQMMPLMIRMIDGLDEFISLDVPFHLSDREREVQRLRRNVDRADLTVAEKFRQVLEAYKYELEYGRSIDTYQGTVEVGGVEREVNFFRVGRIALLYQTTDTEVTGAWDQAERQWVELDSREYRNAVMQGLRIARRQAAIDILKLPISAPEAVN